MATRILTVLLTLLTLAQAVPSRKAQFIGVPISNPEVPDVVANRYIVVYNSTFDEEAITAHQSKWTARLATANLGKRSLDGRILSTAVSTFKLGTWRAMACEADEHTVSQIFDSDEVAYIEADTRVSINALSTQEDSTTGLARLSHADAGTPGYVFDSTAGEGITAFVVDTGIMISHSEFQGRATWGANFVNDVVRTCPLLLFHSEMSELTSAVRTPTKTATAAT